MASSIVITNVNGKKFTFYDGEVNSARYGVITKIFKAPLPGSSAEDQIVINLGKEKVLSGDFKLLDTPGSDAGAGSSPANSGTIETISEKLTYIDEVLLTDGVDDLYTVVLTSHNGSLSSKSGNIENFNFNFSGSNPNSLTGNFSFSVGGGQQNQ